jgi:hypothetical protein
MIEALRDSKVLILKFYRPASGHIEEHRVGADAFYVPMIETLDLAFLSVNGASERDVRSFLLPEQWLKAAGQTRDLPMATSNLTMLRTTDTVKRGFETPLGKMELLRMPTFGAWKLIKANLDKQGQPTYVGCPRVRNHCRW